MENIQDLFWKALQEKHLSEAESYLNQGADIEWKNINGETPLRFFAANGKNHRDAAEWLIAKGANIDATDRRGDSALMHIIHKRDTEGFKWIIQNSPDVQLANKTGSSPLMLACTIKKEEIVKGLLENGASPDGVSILGASPLLNALGRGDEKVVNMLIEHGANVNVKDDDNSGILHILAMNEDARFVLDLAKKIIDKVDVNAKNNFGTTPIVFLTARGHFDTTELLIDHGANPNSTSLTRDNVTPLMISVSSMKVGLVEKMLKAGANTNAVDLNGNNVNSYLATAVSQINSMENVESIIKMTELLIDAGMDVKACTSKTGITPITIAVNQIFSASKEQREVYKELIAFFIDKGFPVDPAQPVVEKLKNPEDADYDYNIELKKKEIFENLAPSPLVHAITNKDLEVADILLKAGADPNKLNIAGFSPMHAVANITLSPMENAALQVVQNQPGMTQEIYEKQVSELNVKIFEDQKEALKKLIYFGGDINIAGKEGITPIMVMVEKGLFNLTGAAFIDFGADPLKKDDYDDSAVSLSLKYAKPRIFNEFVHELEKQGRIGEMKNILNDAVLSSPDDTNLRYPFIKLMRVSASRPEWINAQDENGNTPLFLATATQQHDVVVALIEMGADVNIQNNKGETPIMQAFLNEERQSVFKLKEAGADLNIRNMNGQSIFTMANSYDLRSLLVNLEEHVVKEEEPALSSNFIEELNGYVAGGWSHKGAKKALKM